MAKKNIKYQLSAAKKPRRQAQRQIASAAKNARSAWHESSMAANSVYENKRRMALTSCRVVIIRSFLVDERVSDIHSVSIILVMSVDSNDIRIVIILVLEHLDKQQHRRKRHMAIVAERLSVALCSQTVSLVRVPVVVIVLNVMVDVHIDEFVALNVLPLYLSRQTTASKQHRISSGVANNGEISK